MELLIFEHEPADAVRLLAGDDVDLALTYDYNLSAATTDRAVTSTRLWTAAWGLGVPTPSAPGHSDNALQSFDRYCDAAWIVNSRNTADEHVVRIIASMAGFQPRITHQVDSLELVQDLIAAGLGVGLLPVGQPTVPEVRLLELHDPAVTLRSYALTRQGRARWPPLELVLSRLAGAVGLTPTLP